MWIVLLYLVLFGFACMNQSYIAKNKKLTFCLFAFVLLLLIFSFPLGKDINAYVSTFNRVEGFMDAFKYHMSRNFGFNSFMMITKLFTSNALNFRFIANLIALILFGYAIWKNSSNAFFSLALFVGNGIFVVYFGSALRQCIAMAIFIFAYFQFYLKDKKNYYYLFAILAFSFHEVGVAMLLIPFFDYLFIKFKSKEIFYISTFIFSCVSFVIFTIICPLIFEIIRGDSVFTHFLSYFAKSEFSLVGFLLRVCMLFAHGYIFTSLKEKQPTDYQLFNVLYLSCLIYICFANFQLFSRVSDFLVCIEIIFIPNVISRIECKSLKLLSFIGIFALTTVLFVVDLKEVVSFYLNTVNILAYPYIFSFDFKTIQSYLSLV